MIKPWREGKKLAIPEDTDLETWKNAGRELARHKRRLTWEIIDWLAFGDRKWGVTYDWAAEMMDTHPQTLRNYVSIYNHAGFIMRDYKLGITFYQAIAHEKLPDDDKAMLLEIADGKRPAREGEEPKRLTRDAFVAYVDAYMVNMGYKEPKQPKGIKGETDTRLTKEEAGEKVASQLPKHETQCAESDESESPFDSTVQETEQFQDSELSKGGMNEDLHAMQGDENGGDVPPKPGEQGRTGVGVQGVQASVEEGNSFWDRLQARVEGVLAKAEYGESQGASGSLPSSQIGKVVTEAVRDLWGAQNRSASLQGIQFGTPSDSSLVVQGTPSTGAFPSSMIGGDRNGEAGRDRPVLPGLPEEASSGSVPLNASATAGGGEGVSGGGEVVSQPQEIPVEELGRGGIAILQAELSKYQNAVSVLDASNKEAAEEIERLRGEVESLRLRLSGPVLAIPNDLEEMIRFELSFRQKASRGMDATLDFESIGLLALRRGLKVLASDHGRKR